MLVEAGVREVEYRRYLARGRTKCSKVANVSELFFSLAMSVKSRLRISDESFMPLMKSSLGCSHTDLS